MDKGVPTTSGASGSGGPGVGEMFDRIAPTYDFLNHLLSLGRDYSWRRRTARRVAAHGPARVVDLATGTGDLLIALLRECSGVEEAVGLDVSEAMLKIGREKVARYDFGGRVRFVRDDAVQSTLPAGGFDAVTMGFGIRNTPDARATLGEIHRLLRPGGLAAILEFSLPACPVMRGCYLAYLRWVVPVIGAVVSGDKRAYRYLNTSIEAFHRPDDFCTLMEEAGFCAVSAAPLTWGVASIYTGTKA